MVEHREAKVELQSCSSLRKLCASYRVEFGIKNLHTQFECKELWGRKLDVEDEVFNGEKKERKRLGFVWRSKTWAFGALLQLELASFLTWIVFFPINFVGVPSLSSPLWLLDVIDSGGSLLLLCLSLSGSFSPKVFKCLPSYLKKNYDVVPFNWRV